MKRLPGQHRSRRKSGATRMRRAAWARALRLMRALYAKGPLPAEPRWTRESLYEDENGNLRGAPKPGAPD